MIIAIYSKYKANDKWLLHAVAKNVEVAKKEVKVIIDTAKQIGYDNADAIIQSFDTYDNMPGVLTDDKVKSEKVLYN